MRRNPNKNAHPWYRDALSVTRFWNLVDKQGPNDCWPWLGDKDKNGYGVFQFQGSKRGAHELALSFTTGEAKLEKLDTCHNCDNPWCVNPAHLRFDTRHSNVTDMMNRGRRARQGKLSDDEIILIRERRAAGARQQDLADHFGVSDGAISMIVRGKRWPHVGGPIENERQYIHHGK